MNYLMMRMISIYWLTLLRVIYVFIYLVFLSHEKLDIKISLDLNTLRCEQELPNLADSMPPWPQYRWGKEEGSLLLYRCMDNSRTILGDCWRIDLEEQPSLGPGENTPASHWTARTRRVLTLVEMAKYSDKISQDIIHTTETILL